MRILAYSTDMSRHRWAPPTCSAARATAARSSVLDSPARRRPSVPISRAGVSANSSRACLRVWSMVASGVRVSPAASPFTANSDTPAVGAGRDQDQVGGVAVEHERLVAVERPAVARAGVAARVMPVVVPPARVLGEGQGGDGLARRRSRAAGTSWPSSSPEVSRALAARATVEKYGAHSRARAHLLEHHDQLDVGEAGAAELLGDGQALQAELLGHLGPDRGVVALGGLHQPADLGLGRLVLEEAADRLAQLFLLLAEGEVHRVLHPPGRPSAAVRPRVYPSVYQNPADGDQRVGASTLPLRAPEVASTMAETVIDYEDTAAEIHQVVVGPDGQQRLHRALPGRPATPC